MLTIYVDSQHSRWQLAEQLASLRHYLQSRKTGLTPTQTQRLVSSLTNWLAPDDAQRVAVHLFDPIRIVALN